jgi:type IV pilus assembly protein PilM
MAEQGYLNEVTQAVSVAAAYFEDTLEVSPGAVLSAGSVSAQALGAMLAEAGFGEMMDAGSRIRVREVVGEDSLAGQAVTSTVPRGWLAGVRGALRS